MCHFFFDRIVTHSRIRYVPSRLPHSVKHPASLRKCIDCRSISVRTLASRRLDYYFRFDTDTRFVAPVNVDVFDHMGAHLSGVHDK